MPRAMGRPLKGQVILDERQDLFYLINGKSLTAHMLKAGQSIVGRIRVGYRGGRNRGSFSYSIKQRNFSPPVGFTRGGYTFITLLDPNNKSVHWIKFRKFIPRATVARSSPKPKPVPTPPKPKPTKPSSPVNPLVANELLTPVIDARHMAGLAVIDLPGPVHRLRVGAGGRLLFLHIRATNQLVIVDIQSRRIVKALPVPNDLRFAANRKYLILIYPSQNAMQRWSLKDLRRDKIATLSGEPQSAVMGSSGSGPLALWSEQTLQLWDVQTLKRIKTMKLLASRFGRYGYSLTVSADGKTFCGWIGGISGQKFHVLKVLNSRDRQSGCRQAGPYEYHDGGNRQQLATGLGWSTVHSDLGARQSGHKWWPHV